MMRLDKILFAARSGYKVSLLSLKLTKATPRPIIILPTKAPARKTIRYEIIISPSLD
jgi:hypothetical protein